MDILIAQTPRGMLQIKQKAFNKLLKITVLSSLEQQVKEVEIFSEVYLDHYFYILVVFNLGPHLEKIVFEEKKIIHQIENMMLQILDTRPKNVAIAYQRK